MKNKFTTFLLIVCPFAASAHIFSFVNDTTGYIIGVKTEPSDNSACLNWAGGHMGGGNTIPPMYPGFPVPNIPGYNNSSPYSNPYLNPFVGVLPKGTNDPISEISEGYLLQYFSSYYDGTDGPSCWQDDTNGNYTDEASIKFSIIGARIGGNSSDAHILGELTFRSSYEYKNNFGIVTDKEEVSKSWVFTPSQYELNNPTIILYGHQGNNMAIDFIHVNGNNSYGSQACEHPNYWNMMLFDPTGNGACQTPSPDPGQK